MVVLPASRSALPGESRPAHQPRQRCQLHSLVRVQASGPRDVACGLSRGSCRFGIVRRGVNATFVQARTSDSVCTSVHAGSTGCDGEVKRLGCARERLVLMCAYVHADSAWCDVHRKHFFVEARVSDNVFTYVHAGSTGCDGDVKRFCCARERLVRFFAAVHTGSVCDGYWTHAFVVRTIGTRSCSLTDSCQLRRWQASEGWRT